MPTMTASAGRFFVTSVMRALEPCTMSTSCPSPAPTASIATIARPVLPSAWVEHGEGFAKGDRPDNLGGTATFVNLPEGGRTTTIESKTNFFQAIAVGDKAVAECTPLHKGRTTMVWQTRITRADGKLCAMVTQTQIAVPASGAEE